jgi:S1-C subfamily serine protease
MDPEEIDWAIQNSDRIMDQEFQVTPYAGGGLKIESVAPGSLGAMRGLIPGDVIKDINGQPLTSLADIRTLMNSPALRQSSGLRLTLERAGKPVILEYRPLPRQ